MKTVEGVEIPLGKLKEMSVKQLDKYELDLEIIAEKGHMLLDDVKTSQPRISGLFVPPNELFLTAKAKVWYDSVLDRVKPANYKD